MILKREAAFAEVRKLAEEIKIARETPPIELTQPDAATEDDKAAAINQSNDFKRREDALFANPFVARFMRVYMVDIVGHGVDREKYERWLLSSKWRKQFTDSGGTVGCAEGSWHLGVYCSEEELPRFIGEVTREFCASVANGKITFRRMKWSLFDKEPLSGEQKMRHYGICPATTSALEADKCPIRRMWVRAIPNPVSIIRRTDRQVVAVLSAEQPFVYHLYVWVKQTGRYDWIAKLHGNQSECEIAAYDVICAGALDFVIYEDRYFKSDHMRVNDGTGIDATISRWSEKCEEDAVAFCSKAGLPPKCEMREV